MNSQLCTMTTVIVVGTSRSKDTGGVPSPFLKVVAKDVLQMTEKFNIKNLRMRKIQCSIKLISLSV